MNILGVHASFNSHTHDPAVCLVKDGVVEFAIEEERLTRIKTSSGLFPERGLKSALDYCGLTIGEIDLISVDGATYHEMESKVQSFIEHLFGECPLISTVHHPLAHGYGAFFSSSFTRAIVFSVDGVGDRESTNVFLADRDQGLQIVHKEPIETSLGIFYSVFTSFLGFKSIEGEYKLMGMASYGEPRFRDVVESI